MSNTPRTDAATEACIATALVRLWQSKEQEHYGSAKYFRCLGEFDSAATNDSVGATYGICAKHLSGLSDAVVTARFARKLERENDKLRGLLWRCLPIIEADAQMMADITRHAPLDPASQAAHDSEEYESEKLLREIPAMLAEENV